MRILQVTIGSGTNTQVTTNTNIYCTIIVFQDNAGANCRIGDSTVTSTKGIQLATGSPGGSATFQINTPRGSQLSQYYIAGTTGNVIDVLYETAQ